MAIYGQNIFDIGAEVTKTLRFCRWSDAAIREVMRQIGAAKSYDEAVDVCRKYITVTGGPGGKVL